MNSPSRPAFLLVGFLLLSGALLKFLGRPIHVPGFLAMTVFYGLVFYIGAWAGQKDSGGDSQGDAEELMLAGRSLPLWVAIFTMGATWVGGGYINGSAEYTMSHGLVWVQAPWGYALSLCVGGLIFARPMRRQGFRTMLDPLERRFGKKMAALLYLPALTGELFWTAAILTALGTTFGTVLGLDTTPSILLSAFVAVAYTALGGLWAVAFTDVIQMILLLVGLWLVIPSGLAACGGLEAVWTGYQKIHGANASFLPPWGGWADPAWKDSYWVWWDTAFLLIFGGIPWHVYFQRVLASRDEDTAVRLSVAAAGVCLFAAVPAILLGMIAAVYPWESLAAGPPPEASLALPWVVRHLSGPVVSTIGLGAVAAAVMSSVDSSILSASSMAAWNVYRPLVRPEADSEDLARVIRGSIWVVGGLATLLALKVQSVYALWFLCSDCVYTVLFPQLTMALFDPKANTPGAVAGFVVASSLRLLSGDPTLGIPVWIAWPGFDAATQTQTFPFRTASMLAGLLSLALVSRWTQSWSPARDLEAEPEGSP